MYNKDNIFYKIANKQIDCNLLYEDDFAVAFNDIQPVAPVHILVVPKNEYASFDDFIIKATEKEVSGFFKAVYNVASKYGNVSYRLVTNHGGMSSQTVFHFHVHVIAGKQLHGLIGEDAKDD